MLHLRLNLRIILLLIIYITFIGFTIKKDKRIDNNTGYYILKVNSKSIGDKIEPMTSFFKFTNKWLTTRVSKNMITHTVNQDSVFEFDYDKAFLDKNFKDIKHMDSILEKIKNQEPDYQINIFNKDYTHRCKFYLCKLKIKSSNTINKSIQTNYNDDYKQIIYRLKSISEIEEIEIIN